MTKQDREMPNIIIEDRSLNKAFAAARSGARSLVLYRSLLNDPVISEWLGLLDAVAEGADRSGILECYHTWCSRLLAYETALPWSDRWQSYLAERVLYQENPFSLAAEHVSADLLEPGLMQAARHDLELLQRFFDCGVSQTAELVERSVGKDGRVFRLPPFRFDAGLSSTGLFLLESVDWTQEATNLANYYHFFGSGVFARFHAFRWQHHRPGIGKLIPINEPDSVSFDDLIGLERQKEQVMTNTEYLLARLPSNHILLYGKRGTGKSSLVKAILSEYAGRGLRLIELGKQDLGELSSVLAEVRGRAFTFLLFIDDLSFEEYEVQYKELKGMLEGGIDAVPSNVRVYATSNRRHLIREYFSDRKHGEEIHLDDSAQEKLSVADRFGITILFPTPAQQGYLQIVHELAARSGLALSGEELERKALEWEKTHHGLSGRTARQFIDRLVAESRYRKPKVTL